MRARRRRSQRLRSSKRVTCLRKSTRLLRFSATAVSGGGPNSARAGTDVSNEAVSAGRGSKSFLIPGRLTFAFNGPALRSTTAGSSSVNSAARRLSFQLCAVDAERNVDVATRGIRVSGSARGLGALRITFSAKELRPSISRRLDLAPPDGCPDDAVVAVPDHADDHHPISDGQPCVLVLRDAHQIDADTGAEVRLHGHQLAGDPLHAPVETDPPLLRYRGL